MDKQKNILKEHNIVPYKKIVNRFKTQNMCAIVHATGTGKEKAIGDWVGKQRQSIKNGTMRLTRYKMLRRINFVTSTKEKEDQIKANKDFFENADDIFSK